MTKCKEALNNNQERETANAVSSNEILKREQSKIRDAKRDEWLRQYVQQYLQSEKHLLRHKEILREGACEGALQERKYNKDIAKTTTSIAGNTEKRSILKRSNDTAQRTSNNKRVHFPPSTSELVTAIYTRPFTPREDISLLYYSAADEKRFRRDARSIDKILGNIKNETLKKKLIKTFGVSNTDNDKEDEEESVTIINKRYDESRNKSVDNSECGNRQQWEVVEKEDMEEWKDVKAGKNTNKYETINNTPSLVKVHNSYESLPQYTGPLPSQEIIQKDTNNKDDKVVPIANINKSKLNHYQEKVLRRIAAKQLAKQQKAYEEANEDALIENYVTKEEDEITATAKKNNAKLKLFIQVLQKTQQNKPSLIQKGRNASYNFSTTLGKALSSLLQPDKKRVQFAKETSTRMFDKQDESIVLMTYDSGADGHYMSEKDRKQLHLPILKQSTKRVGVANGDVVQGKYKTTLPLPQLSTKATTADSFNTWPSSLVSVGKVADDNTVSIFDKDGVSVYKEEDVLIKYKGEPILVGARDERGRYRIPLIQKRGQWQPRKPSKKAQRALEQANSVYDLPSTEQAIKWMHAVCGYPVKSTWLKAIKAGNFIGWPMLTATNVNKYYPETVETPKGHLNQSRKNVRSTKAKPLSEYANKHQLEGKKEKDVYIKVYDPKETIYSDQTGAFPTRSRSGNKYIMVMVDIDSNAILVEPMKSRKDAEMIRAYNALMLRLTRAGIMPAKHVLDNEVSENMKDHIRDKYKLTLELVPPGCHRRNAAEVAIRNFKSHFLSVLAGVSDDFPPSLWDKLLPQTEITLNLLRQSNATPTVSAYAHLSGPFDYNKMPLAPMGCKAQIHEKSDKRGTWSYHTIDGWYVRTSPEHYPQKIQRVNDSPIQSNSNTNI